jgi:hypothetical protein
MRVGVAELSASHGNYNYLLLLILPIPFMGYLLGLLEILVL